MFNISVEMNGLCSRLAEALFTGVACHQNKKH